jgi:hypothetical protein
MRGDCIVVVRAPTEPLTLQLHSAAFDTRRFGTEKSADER